MTKQKEPARTPGELLKSLAVGKFTTVKKIEQGGALQARRLSSDGIQFYWRYTHDSKTDRIAIGMYDSTAPPRSLTPTDKGYSIVAAGEVCRIKATIQSQKAASGGYRGHVAAEKRSREAIHTKALQVKDQTLAKLLDAYSDFLEHSGRRSCADTRSMFRLHVREAWPEIAISPASILTAPQVTDMLRRLIDLGKGRTANKLRAYMRAAYQCAIDVDSLASIPASFKIFGITSNPAALTKRDAAHDKADKHPLTLDDLRAYWKIIKKVPGIKGAALRLHLLTGGQRIEQLTKLQNKFVLPDMICIFDGKGRPSNGPRKHCVPLLPKAVETIKEMANGGEYVLSTDGGDTPLNPMTLSHWSKDIASSIPEFQLKRIRSGVETALAAAGVSKDIRGHLQSHGQAGIQARHYDDYDYFREKRDALQLLFDLLERPKEKQPSQPQLARQA